jgi:hypothetical protein
MNAYKYEHWWTTFVHTHTHANTHTQTHTHTDTQTHTHTHLVIYIYGGFAPADGLCSDPSMHIYMCAQAYMKRDG